MYECNHHKKSISPTLAVRPFLQWQNLKEHAELDKGGALQALD